MGLIKFIYTYRTDNSEFKLDMNNRISLSFQKRINEWKDIFPELMNDALEERPSVNVGVYAFRKDSEFMSNWFEYAKHGTHMFIPDEQCCHLLLPKFKNKIVSGIYNTSCKYDEINENTRIKNVNKKLLEEKMNLLKQIFILINRNEKLLKNSNCLSYSSLSQYSTSPVSFLTYEYFFCIPVFNISSICCKVSLAYANLFFKICSSSYECHLSSIINCV